MADLQILPERMRNKTMDDLTDDDMVVRLMRQSIAESREASTSEVAEIDRNWRYYWGQHYLRKVGNQYLPDTTGGDKLRLSRDIIQLSIDALRPIMVKMSPLILALASYPDMFAEIEVDEERVYRVPNLYNSDVAGFMTELKRIEDKRRYEEVLIAEATLDVMVAGQSYRTSIPVYRKGYGTVLYPKLYPRANIHLDPKGTRLTDFLDFKYVIFEDEMDASEIWTNYGLRERDYVNEERASDDKIYNYEERGFFRSLTELRKFGQETRRETNFERRIYKVHTGYFNEYAAELHAYHGTPKEVNYPFGRQIVMINEQKIAIDQPNPFEHGQYPLSCLQSQPIPYLGRALSEVGKLRDMQRGTNLLYNSLIGITMLGMNPKLLYEEGAFNPNDWKAGPGGFVRINDGGMDRIQWFTPETDGRGAYNLMKDTEYKGKEDVAGVTASLQGQELHAGASGRYANTLQSSSMVGPTFKIQNLDAGHHRFAELEMELMQQYVDIREPYYAMHHDIDQYHPMLPDAIRDIFYKLVYESRAELPHNPIARHNFFWNQFNEGVIDFEQYLLLAQPPMRPALREAARQGSLENYMPGVPREFRLELMANEMAAEQQLQDAENAQGQLNKQITQNRYRMIGDSEDFTSDGIAGSSDGPAL